MPDAYDQDGVVNQEKRFAVALQRYRSVYTGNIRCLRCLYSTIVTAGTTLTAYPLGALSSPTGI